MPLYKIERTTIISLEETKDLVEKMPNDRDKSMVAMFYLFGCRPVELCLLTKKVFQINEIEGKLWVNMPNKKKRRDKSVLITSSRWVWAYLTDPFAQIIISYIKGKDMDEVLWRYGSSQKSANATLNRKLKSFNPKVCPYLFRHSRLTRLAENGATSSELTLWAGWEDDRPTKHYVHKTRKMAANVPQGNSLEEGENDAA